jgi:hypothetical protein
MPVVILIYIILALLAFISTVSFLISYRKTKNIDILKLSWPFFFIMCYNFLMGVPALFTQEPSVLAWSLFFGLVAVFLSILSAYRLPIFEKSPVFGRAAPFLIILSIVVAFIVLTLEFFDPELPRILESGLIEWNIEKTGALLLGSLCFFTGLSWGFLFLKNSRLASNQRSRLKVYVLAGDGILFGIAGFVYFFSQGQRETIIAHLIMVIALSFTAVVFAKARLSEKEETLDSAENPSI